MNGIPVIRLEIEGMKHAVIHAMTRHLAQMDSEIQAAVEHACKPEHISALIETTARGEIAKAVKSEIENFYRYGPGRKAIKEAVVRALEEEEE